MGPAPALLALSLSLPLRAAPVCPPRGAGAQSTNWGPDYRERVQDIFDTVKKAAGAEIDPDLLLINVNDLPQNRGTRLINGSPLVSMKRGTQGLPHDAILYTYGIFEVACDEAQLAFLTAHEMGHLRRTTDGKNHFDRGSACLKDLFLQWANNVDLSAYLDAGVAYMDFIGNEKMEVVEKCVAPLEEDADQFARELSPRLPWKFESDPDNPDPRRDERVLVFKNAENWYEALDDPNQAAMAARAEANARAAQTQAEERLQKSLAAGIP